jgi:hypothetical protein
MRKQKEQDTGTSTRDLEIYDVGFGLGEKVNWRGKGGRKAGTWKLGKGEALSKQFQVVCVVLT